jgi:hypothetical protein
MVSSTRIPLSLTLGGNSRKQIHGSAPHIMVLCLKVASHSMCPKGKPFPCQLGRAIATTFPHLPRRLSQAKGNLALIPLVGTMTRRRGVEYEPSFEFLKHYENLNLSTSVAHLKKFFSTTNHTNKSFLSKYHTKR